MTELSRKQFVSLIAKAVGLSSSDVVAMTTAATKAVAPTRALEAATATSTAPS